MANKPLNRGFKKIDPAKLLTYVKEHSDDTQKEIAAAFGCCNQAVSKALRRLNVTRKKTRRYKERDAEKAAVKKSSAKLPGKNLDRSIWLPPKVEKGLDLNPTLTYIL